MTVADPQSLKFSTLAEALALAKSLTAAQKAKVAAVLRAKNPALWIPQPGPQTAAYESEADIIFYGGAAGGGKTDLILGLCLTQHEHSMLCTRS